MIQEQDNIELDINIAVSIHHIEHVFDEQINN